MMVLLTIMSVPLKKTIILTLQGVASTEFVKRWAFLKITLVVIELSRQLPLLNLYIKSAAMIYYV